MKEISRRGFTLIEVLVVITIIGIILSIITVNFNESRKRARDNVRKSNLQSLQLSIETYKAQNGQYPTYGCGVTSGWTGRGPQSISGFTSCSDFISGLTPDFIGALPVDPNEDVSNKGFYYQTNADRSAYKVMAYDVGESQLVTSYADEFARCPSNCSNAQCGTLPQSSTYAVYSAGAECW